MPENLKRFASGHRSGLRTAIILCSFGLAVFVLLLAALTVMDRYTLHAVKMGLFFLAAACFAGLIWAILVRNRHTVQTKFTCSLYGEQQLNAIDAEVGASAGYYQRLGLAVTQSSLLSHGEGLVIVPMDDIVNITCRASGSTARLVMRSRAGGETLLPSFKLDQQAHGELHTLAGWLAARIPALTVGAQNNPANGQPFDTLPGFFATDTAAGLHMQPDVPGPGGETRKLNYGAGLLGAIMGAVIGGALWGVIGLMGYISAWLGLLVVILAFLGFMQTAGRVNHAAGVIGIAVSLAVVFAANYLEYAATLADALADYYYVTVFDVLPDLFSLLSEIDILGQFWMEYLIGAGLILLCGILAIVGLSSKKTFRPSGVVAADQSTSMPAAGGAVINGQPVYGTQPQAAGTSAGAYTAPAAPVADHTKYEVRWPKRSNAGWIILLVFAVFMLIAAVASGMFLFSDDSALSIMMGVLLGVMGVVYLVLALFNRRTVKNFCITYDDRTISLTKPSGKTLTCAWTEVRNLRFSAASLVWGAGRMFIDAPYGKINFTTQMPGYDHLMNYARTYAVNAAMR